MSNPYGYSNTIEKAAARCRGTILTPLHRVAESQKTISTRKLSALLDDLQDDLRLDAIHFKVLADRLQAKDKRIAKLEGVVKSILNDMEHGAAHYDTYFAEKIREALNNE